MPRCRPMNPDRFGRSTIPPAMRALLILNDAAGSLKGEHDAASSTEVVDAFAAAGLPVGLRTGSPAELAATFQGAVEERPEIIFVGGGDGTISSAAGYLVDTPIALGVLPLGTLNHFARDLGIPATWRDAIPALVDGRTRAVDVGEINGRVFINNCSLGSYPEAVRRRDALRRAHGAGKWAAMFLASITVFRRLRRLRVRIESPSAHLTLRTPFVFIGNNAYSGHVLGPNLRPQLDAGQLWIYTTQAHRRLALLRLAWQSLVRQIDAADALDALPIREAVITTEGPREPPLAMDGELVESARILRCRVRPRALRVRVPGAATPAPT